MSYTIEDIARIIGARRIGDRPAAIDWLLTDSRSLSFPKEIELCHIRLNP